MHTTHIHTHGSIDFSHFTFLAMLTTRISMTCRDVFSATNHVSLAAVSEAPLLTYTLSLFSVRRCVCLAS